MREANPIAAWALTILAVHSLLVVIGFFRWEPLLLFGFVWPYPLLLALKAVLNPDSSLAWLAALGLGFLLVGLVAVWTQRLFTGRRLEPPTTAILGFAAVLLPLAAITGVAYAVAKAAHWPVGE